MPESQIKLVASRQFASSGDFHQVVTFLNRTLKDDNLIFGLSRDEEGIYRLNIYRVEEGGPGSIGSGARFPAGDDGR